MCLSWMNGDIVAFSQEFKVKSRIYMVVNLYVVNNACTRLCVLKITDFKLRLKLVINNGLVNNLTTLSRLRMSFINI